MSPSELAAEIQERLLALCWSQWAQMGLLTSPSGEPSRRAQDPEALLVMTLEVGRADARLFDETLDWSASNGRLLSLRRLRAMCVDDEDRALVDGTARWLEWERTKPVTAGGQLRDLFLDGGPIRELDPAFASAGLARPLLQRTGRSLSPDLSLPINLSLRLRAILGVGIRAEVVRILLTIRAGWMTAAPLARTSGYTKRNVHDALTSLSDAQVIRVMRTGGGELRYAIDPIRWAALLGCAEEELPGHLEWGTLLGALRSVLRWGRAVLTSEASEYLQASQARELLERFAPQLAYAGVSVEEPRRGADDALEALTITVRRTLERCEESSPC